MMNSRLRRIAFSLFAILSSIFPLVAFADDAASQAAPPSVATAFGVLDSREQGAFDIGPALGGVSRFQDPDANKLVLKFDYQASQKSHVGVWTKKYPRGLKAGAVDAVKIGVKVPTFEQTQQVLIKVEIKGKNSWQVVHLHGLKPGWNYFREPLSWNSIGDLSEVVFVVSPIIVGKGTIEGLLYLDLEFFKLSALQKNILFVKIGLVFGLSLLLALLVGLVGRMHKPSGSVSFGWKRDLLYGVVAVLIAGVTQQIYALGAINPLDAGFDLGFLGLCAMGLVIGALLKFGLTGKHLTLREALQDLLVTGFLVVSSGRMEVLQAPASWAQVLTLNNVIAALAFLVYQISNAHSLATSGKHIRFVTGITIFGIPYLFNWLMLTENVAILQTLFNGISHGALAAKPAILEVLGRTLVVFIFNEAVTNAISFGIKGKGVEKIKSHGVMLLVSLGVALSPLIADLGSTPQVASLNIFVRTLVVALTSMLAFGGLWAEVYLITGTALDAGSRMTPSEESILIHVKSGLKKGMAYSGMLMVFLYALGMLLDSSQAQQVIFAWPLVVGTLAGALIFPLFKTIIETFDGSIPFFARARHSYREKPLYARGAIVGFGFAYALSHGFIQQAMPDRILFGLMVGVLASAGVSFFRDVAYASKNQGSIQTWRLYLVDGVMGAFVGSAIAFYLDALQVPVVVEKFRLYISAGFPAKEYTTYPLLNKWGRIDLGTFTGGAKLLFTESLAGVINWSIAAWLFAINKVFLQAIFEKQTKPIKFFFSKAGFAMLVEHMIYVLRWGLWMSPIIFTFLRMMPDPTWYNQDGAIRTLFAMYHNATMSPQAFRDWSLNVFVALMAFDFFRILIWMDHMGLRVATLVNLSFIGMDKLDERVARFIGPATAQRCIPEAVKRFTTWGPLLIPFYLPRGAEWDYVWDTAEAMHNAASVRGGGMIAAFGSLGLPGKALVIAVVILIGAGLSHALRLLGCGLAKRRVKILSLGNRIYRVYLKADGDMYSELDHKKREVYPREYDVTRRSYDTMDPSGRILFVLDAAQKPESNARCWPIVGNFPSELFGVSRLEKVDNFLNIVNSAHGVRTTIQVSLPDKDAAVEIWNVTVENWTAEARSLKIVPYMEWVLNGGLHDRFHTQYARLFPEMSYVSKSNAILAWQKGTKSMGILASDAAPEGFLTSRMDFIGRAQSIWKPRALETMDFLAARETAAYPTFDPIGSFVVDASVGPKSSKTMRLMVGYATSKDKAIALVNKFMKPQPAPAAVVGAQAEKKRALLIGHGEILPGTPQPYYTFKDQGNKLIVHTPYTPRPYDHAMSNPLHSVMVTNRGLHTSCNGNSQQNRLTPDWPDTVTKEMPAEAIYLYDVDSKEWYSPAYHPLNERKASYESEFGVDGTAIFRMSRGDIATELTVFVPPADPLGVYLVTVKNNSDKPKRMRVAPYFQMVLEFQPERSGTLQQRYDKTLDALFFNNSRNMFRNGWAFSAMTIQSDLVETVRGRFFGTGRSAAHPFLVDQGAPDASQESDDRPIASFLATLEIPAHGERSFAVVLGQTEDWQGANQLVQKYKSLETVRACLAETRAWWLGLMKTSVIETSNAAFDNLLNWLKYQGIAERIWARRGFYQTSGAYGFRDQLQDSVNLMWVDPSLARKQILLCAAHQFPEGDVFHWFFTRTDGRTAFSCRSHASDNPLWLTWATFEYIKATNDVSILDEKTSYVWSEFPFADLPKNKEGWGHLYHRSTMADTVYKHCMRSVDLVLIKREGRNGLPLIRTGDWNDGLDEIGSQGKGESVWLGFFGYYILKGMIGVIERKEGKQRKEYYQAKLNGLETALEAVWREDRYLRAIHDDGTEIGVKGSGIWEVDALTAAWAVMADINFDRAVTAFNTALAILEKDNAVLLGWPALREDTKPYLGRSSKYPEGVRENGMYCHGVQWLVRAARILAEKFEKRGDHAKADGYRETAIRLWLKISPIAHVTATEIEIYGGQPNKQPADILTNFDRGRMIWNGYTGAAGWMIRQAFEGVVGATLSNNTMTLPDDLAKPRGELKINRVFRDLANSPLSGNPTRPAKASRPHSAEEPVQPVGTNG